MQLLHSSACLLSNLIYFDTRLSESHFLSITPTFEPLAAIPLGCSCYFSSRFDQHRHHPSKDSDFWIRPISWYCAISALQYSGEFLGMPATVGGVTFALDSCLFKLVVWVSKPRASRTSRSWSWLWRHVTLATYTDLSTCTQLCNFVFSQFHGSHQFALFLYTMHRLLRICWSSYLGVYIRLLWFSCLDWTPRRSASGKRRLNRLQLDVLSSTHVWSLWTALDKKST